MTAEKHPKPIWVPHLREKLGVLYLLRGLDDAKLARMFGLTAKAIRNWVQGDGSREPEHIPARRFQQLVEIFREQMRHRYTEEEVRGWLTSHSHVNLMHAMLSEGPAVDWLTLVLGAERSTATVIVGDGRRQATLRIDPLESLETTCEVAVRQVFRLRLKIPSRGWLCVVQWGRSGWFGLELAEKQVVLHVQEGDCMLPPCPPYLKETEVGQRRYVIMHATQPFPPDVEVMLLNSARPPAPLHADSLVRLAQVVGEINVDMKVLDIAFTDGMGP